MRRGERAVVRWRCRGRSWARRSACLCTPWPPHGGEIEVLLGVRTPRGTEYGSTGWCGLRRLETALPRGPPPRRRHTRVVAGLVRVECARGSVRPPAPHAAKRTFSWCAVSTFRNELPLPGPISPPVLEMSYLPSKPQFLSLGSVLCTRELRELRDRHATSETMTDVPIFQVRGGAAGYGAQPETCGALAGARRSMNEGHTL